MTRYCVVAEGPWGFSVRSFATCARGVATDYERAVKVASYLILRRQRSRSWVIPAGPYAGHRYVRRGVQ